MITRDAGAILGSALIVVSALGCAGPPDTPIVHKRLLMPARGELAPLLGLPADALSAPAGPGVMARARRFFGLTDGAD